MATATPKFTVAQTPQNFASKQSRPIAWFTGLLLSLMYSLVIVNAAHAQTQAQDLGRSYKDRQNPKLSQSGPIYMDPNVYAYSAEFAKRFQMPEEWIAPDLKGADAVAWRMMPSYQECGWGGDPKACRQVMECKIDLYFDHRRNPLPWDPTRAERYTTISGSSLNFLANFPRREALSHPNYPVARRQLFEPARPGDRAPADSSPFIDPQSGKGLSVQNFAGYQALTGYDKEVFPGMALFTLLDIGCRGGPRDATFILASDLVRLPLSAEKKAAIAHTIVMPQSWRDRITQTAKEHQERQDAFFRREGEKAIKALREQTKP
jgi:hypothetical protein